MGPTGPTSSWRPFGPAFGPSGLLTHYPMTASLRGSHGLSARRA